MKTSTSILGSEGDESFSSPNPRHPVRRINRFAVMILMLVTFVIGVAGSALWYLTCVTSVDRHELGFVFDRFSGKIEVVKHSGWVVRWPWRESVHTIDLRPYQVSISANERILNAKLVQFNPQGLETFVAWHGRSAGDDVESLKEILKCYAFDRDGGTDCPFLIVLGVLAPNQGGAVTSTPVTRPQ